MSTRIPVLRLLDEKIVSTGMILFVICSFPFIILEMIFFELNNFDKYLPFLIQQFLIVYIGLVFFLTSIIGFIFIALRSSIPELREKFEKDVIQREENKVTREKLKLEKLETIEKLKQKQRTIKEMGKKIPVVDNPIPPPTNIVLEPEPIIEP